MTQEIMNGEVYQDCDDDGLDDLIRSDNDDDQADDAGIQAISQDHGSDESQQDRAQIQSQAA